MLYSVNSIYFKQFLGGKKLATTSTTSTPNAPKTEKEIKAQPLKPTSA
jgi:hypothetical protein